MGYCVSVNSDNFSFKYGKEKEIMASIKEAIKNKQICEGRWIDLNMALKLETLEGIFDEFRFELRLDNKEKVYKIEFYGEKFGGYEESFFKAIAPYSNDGYIEYIGEDGDKWRYIFKNGECKEVYPKLIWNEDEMRESLKKIKSLISLNINNISVHAPRKLMRASDYIFISELSKNNKIIKRIIELVDNINKIMDEE